MCDAGGGPGRGGARRRRSSSPRCRPKAQQNCGRPVPRLRPGGATGIGEGRRGWGGGDGGHALAGRLGPGATGVLESGAGTPGLRSVIECPERWRHRLLLGAEGFWRQGGTSAREPAGAQRGFFYPGTSGALLSPLQGGLLRAKVSLGAELPPGPRQWEVPHSVPVIRQWSGVWQSLLIHIFLPGFLLVASEELGASQVLDKQATTRQLPL